MSLQRQTEKQGERTEAGAARAHDPFEWPFAAAKLAVDACFWWVGRENGLPCPRESAVGWTTPNAVALELSSMRLRDFSRSGSGQPVLICAPYALHRAEVVDFAGGHSIVESLQRGGIDRIYLTDWRSASPDMRYLSIDNYLADLNTVIDDIGSPVDLLGLCQGGWLSLIYAARFPEKIRRLVLVGAPVDLSVESALLQLVRSLPQAVFDQVVARGHGNVSGDEMLGFWGRSASQQDAEATLQCSLSEDIPHDRELLDRFRRWYGETLDLPGTYYLQVVNWMFRENRIATGRFVALGREIRLHEVTAPVFLLVGQNDEVVPVEQALATARLLGTPPPFVEDAIEPSNHLGLFMGARTHANSWPRIARWLQSDLAGFRARTVRA